MSQDAHQTSNKKLDLTKKKSIALDSLSNSGATAVAATHGVARNTVYTEQRRAKAAIAKEYQSKDQEVLFTLSVNKSLINKIIVSLFGTCKASYRDTNQFLNECFGLSASDGHICNTLDASSINAKNITKAYDYSSVERAASDEVFHNNRPLLATVDIPSRYCLSLEKQQTRCGIAWGCHLLDLQKQNFNPAYATMDAGTGLSAGYELAMPETTVLLDHFHIMYKTTQTVRYLKNKKESSMSYAVDISCRLDKAKTESDQVELKAKLEAAEDKSAQAEQLYSDIKTIAGWFQYDVLQFPSIKPSDREDLYDFIIESLEERSSLSHRIKKLLTAIINQRALLMQSIYLLNDKLSAISEKHNISLDTAWKVAYLGRYSMESMSYNILAEDLELTLGSKFDSIENEILLAIDTTDRTSCMVENFNSRLAPYLDPRKNFKTERFDLIQFALNHRRFKRSARPELVNKTPIEIMSGNSHPNWLEMLGFPPVQKAA